MLNKLVLRFVLALSLVVSASTSAALITQDIIDDNLGGVIGSITVNTKYADDWGEITKWTSFEFFGFEAVSADLFVAEIDTEDFYAGILSLDFDVTDECFGCEWAYNGYIDDFSGSLDIFELNSNFVYFSDTLRFGEASVVPEPSAVVLLLSGLIALSVRRKVKK